MSQMMTVTVFPEKHLKDVLSQPARVMDTLGFDFTGNASEVRRFEFREGSSDKFWEISVGDDSFTVRFGKRGTAGQSKTKEVDDPQEEADALIKEKTSRGYREVDVSPLSFDSDTVQLEKSWSGLHYLLTGTAYEGKAPLNFLCLGGTEVPALDTGYGPARVVDAAGVKRIATALEAFTTKTVRAAYDPEEMDALDVYPADWVDEGESGLEWLESNIDQLRKLVKKAATKKHAMIIWT